MLTSGSIFLRQSESGDDSNASEKLVDSTSSEYLPGLITFNM